MKLPAALSHWAQYLNIFPEEVSLALAPIVQRVSLLVGPLGPRFRGAEGEPDGFSGLDGAATTSASCSPSGRSPTNFKTSSRGAP